MDLSNNLNIVLVEPQIPQNTGNIARTAAATGLKLHIVRPCGFVVTDKHLKRAGLDYWDSLSVVYYDSVSDFFEKHNDENNEFFFFTTKAPNVYSDVKYENTKNTFLLFGREDKGLDEKLLHDNLEKCVRIPMFNDSRSLNLSNSVAIAVYEVLRQWDFNNLKNTGHLTEYNY